MQIFLRVFEEKKQQQQQASRWAQRWMPPETEWKPRTRRRRGIGARAGPMLRDSVPPAYDQPRPLRARATRTWEHRARARTTTRWKCSPSVPTLGSLAHTHTAKPRRPSMWCGAASWTAEVVVVVWSIDRSVQQQHKLLGGALPSARRTRHRWSTSTGARCYLSSNKARAIVCHHRWIVWGYCIRAKQTQTMNGPVGR